MGSVGRAARGVAPKDRNKAATAPTTTPTRSQSGRKEAKPLSDMAAASLWFFLAVSAFCTAAAVIATPLANANANEDWEDPSRSVGPGWGDSGGGERWYDGKRASASSLRIMKRFPGEEMRIMKRYPGEDMRIMRRMSPEFDRLRIMKRFPGESMRIMKKRDVSSA